jgi:hypothetical protein
MQLYLLKVGRFTAFKNKWYNELFGDFYEH